MNIFIKLLLSVALALALGACEDDKKRDKQTQVDGDAKERLEAAKARMEERREERRAARQAQRQNNANQAPAADPAAAEPVSKEDREQRRAQMLTSRAWWNDEAVAGELALTEEQRAAMDALLLERRMAEKPGDFRLAWVQPLKAGDLEAARAAAASAADAQRDQNYGNLTLMIDIFALLDPTQQAQLVADHPQFVEGPAIEREGARSERGNKKGKQRGRRGRNQGADAGAVDNGEGQVDQTTSDATDSEPDDES